MEGAAVGVLYCLTACGPRITATPSLQTKAPDANIEVPTEVAPLPVSSLTYVTQMHARLDTLPANAGLDARMDAASIAKEIGDLWRRESLVRSVLKQRPNDQRIRFLLAETVERQMRFREAKALYLSLQAGNPTRVEPYLGLASTAMEIEGRPAAWQWLARGGKACGKSTRSLMQLAARYKEWDDYPAALRLLTIALKREPMNARLIFEQATTLVQMGKTAEGRVLLEDLLSQESNNASAHRALATVILSEAVTATELEIARRHAETAVSLDANNPDGHWVSAAIYRKLGLLRMAARSYVQALAINPADPQSRFGLAQVYDELGMLTLAQGQMAVYREAAARNRSSNQAIARTLSGATRPDVHLELAREAEKSGNYPVAVREAQTAVGLANSRPGARAYLAALYARLGWGNPPAGPGA